MVINISPSRIDDALNAKRGQMTLDALVLRLSGADVKTDDMLLGTAAHKIVEDAHLSMAPEPRQVEGFTFSLDAVAHLYSLPSLYGTSSKAEEWCHVDLCTDDVSVHVRGRIDLLTESTVVDFKFGKGKMWEGHLKRWGQGAAWRAYSLACRRRPVVFHYTQLVRNRNMVGIICIGETQTATFQPNDETPGELLSMAVEAHEYMEANCPAVYADYRARVERNTHPITIPR